MSPILIGLVVLFLVLDEVLLPPIIARARRKEMNDSVRASAPGEFAVLSHGNTHYQWHGHARGEIIVLIHGLSAPSFIFSAMVPILTASGYRVLTYDLYGRGWSDRPRNRQTGSFFARQLNELLDHQMVGNKVIIAGYSMGGAIASVFAAQYPDRVKNLVLIASAGFRHNVSPTVRFMRDTPVVGDWINTVFAGIYLRSEARKMAQEKSEIPDAGDLMIRETRYRGYTRSILSSLRHFLKKPLDELHIKLGRHGIPTLAIWGEKDDIIPVESAARLTAANTRVETHVVPEADHSLAFNMPQQTVEIMLDFLSTSGEQ